MDVRTVISAEKHYFNAPLPLFYYLCTLNISRAQENIFWLHWGEGQMRGDWKSAIPLQTVANRLSMSVSSVKRAYKELAELGLIRRYGQDRDPRNPMRSAVSITEVLIPEDIADSLLEAPNRARPKAGLVSSDQVPSSAEPSIAKQPQSQASASAPAPAKRRYEPLQEEHEGNRPVFRSERPLPPLRKRSGVDEAQMTPGESALQQEGALPSSEPICPSIPWFARRIGPARKIYPGYAMKLYKKLGELAISDSERDASWNEILWSMEEGSLADEPVPKASNMAIKLLKRRQWVKPWGMPENWQWQGS